MDSRFVLILAYAFVWLAAALRVVGRFGRRRGEALDLAAVGSSVLAVLFLAAGLVWRALERGFWPVHTASERLNVGLLGFLLASLALLSRRRARRVWLIVLLAASLAAVGGLWLAGAAESAAPVYEGGWWLAYVGLSALGGGALLVTGLTAVVGAKSPEGEASHGLGEVTRRALAWGLLTLSAGLASGAWWFQRVLGSYWGDARWLGLAAVGLVAGAAWQLRGEWLRGGWRSALTGALLVICGGFVVLGLGGGVG